MQRLKSIYPSNIVLYPTGTGIMQLPATNAGAKILMYNETPLNIDLDFLNGSTDVIHAWEANYWVLDGNVDTIEWQIDSDSLNIVNPPINAIFLTLYGPDETLRDKTYPVSMIRQIGGQITTLANTSLSSENAALVSKVVDIGNTTINDLLDIYNDGHMVWKVQQSGVAHTMLTGQAAGNPLQLGQAGDIVEVVGQLKVDQLTTLAALTLSGVLTAPGANLIGAAGVLTHILGTLTVDQASTLTGVITAAAANILGTAGNTQSILGGLSVAQASTLTGILTAPAANIFGTAGNLQHILGTLTVDQASTLTGNVTLSGNILNNKTGLVITGATSGTVTLWQPFAGLAKVVVLFFNNYCNVTTTQTLTFPTPFLNGALIFTGGIGASSFGGIYFTLAGAVKTVVPLTGLSSGGGSTGVAQQNCYAYGIYENTNNIDAVNVTSVTTTPHTATVLIVGS